MSVTAVLSYSSIFSWLLNSCMPHFSTLFFLASSQTLGSCQISYLQLLFSDDCCFSITHTHALLHFPLKGRGGCLQDFQFCSPPLRFCPGAPQGVLFSVQQFHLRCADEGRLFPKHISFVSDLFSPCPSSPIQGGLPNAAVLLQQPCCVSVPRETFVMTPVAAGVSPLLSCTLRVWASTLWGCMLWLMSEVKMFINPVD